uniref:Uncharacterized protein n=1 Tax=Noctiluca scintillans TaxID=2966 RepID=A0A7S1AJ33_NOCSC|mmetsp:Transcript_48475/g.128406  ORF Transcript_48475/g.128406 Transcript_48475/m.128406 type:complete len:104 (+) Transcript_48475:97-408(+)
MGPAAEPTVGGEQGVQPPGKPPAGKPPRGPPVHLQTHQWTIKELPRWRRIGAQWGGIIFFGSFCLIGYITKTYNEWQYQVLERDIDNYGRKRRIREREERDIE